MKIAEAIEIIRSVPSSEIGDYDFDEICEALDMAIKALQTDIVHCEECKHYDEGGLCWHPAAELGDTLATEPTDSCSYGEAKEKGTRNGL